MAACGKIQHMFDKPLPDNSTLIESLSWNHINSMNTHVHQSSFTEIFGELYFKEVADSPSFAVSSPSSPSSTSLSSSPASSTCASPEQEPEKEKHDSKSNEQTRKLSPLNSFSSKCCVGSPGIISDGFSSMSSESLQLCTEGLGFESSGNSDDPETQDYLQDLGRSRAAKHSLLESSSGETKRSRIRRGPFPPPISCIGKSGRPWVWFKSYKQDGRFILKEIRIPTQECLHASREDGRLKLHFVHEEEEEDDGDYPKVCQDQGKADGKTGDEDVSKRVEMSTTYPVDKA
uniref:FAF domain-containing protein n=1 Tax=Kalanchoe fedtschenkoi TaxID=63787 RepID=A0A7N1A3R1_KALFE